MYAETPNRKTAGASSPASLPKRVSYRVSEKACLRKNKVKTDEDTMSARTIARTHTEKRRRKELLWRLRGNRLRGEGVSRDTRGKLLQKRTCSPF